MDNFKQPDRRRSMRDIVADLAFRERRDQVGPTLTLVQSPAPATPDASASRPAPADDVVNALSAAQRRAAEQRAAAERLLRETLALEQRLAEEVEQARKAGEHALAQQLASEIDAAAAAEAKAAEQTEAWAKKLDTVASEKNEAEALKHEDESRLAAARRALEIATASCSESNQRYSDACQAEEVARREADEAARALAAKRQARKDLEAELSEVQQRIAGFSGGAPSLATIEELREVESRMRVAERRAADVARGAAS